MLMLTVQRQQLLVKPMAKLSQNAADVLKQRYTQQRSQRYANYMCQHMSQYVYIIITPAKQQRTRYVSLMLK